MDLIKNKAFPRVALVGLGVTGKACIRLLRLLDFPEEKLLLFDQKDQSAQIQDPKKLIELRPEWIIVSPGVPLHSDYIEALKALGAQVTSELELAFSLLENEVIISVTGSLGKSTTTALLGSALSAADANVFCGGNLGTPLATYVADLLEGKRTRARFCVLELSSYQLELFRNLKSQISLFTYLAPNHLERYANLQAYYDSKLQLINHTTDLLVLNEKGGDLLAQIPKQLPTPAVWTSAQDERMLRLQIRHTGMVGAHNLDNFALALCVLEHFSLTEACLPTALKFKGLPHRLEKLEELDGIYFVNDSKATAIDSVAQAVRSVLSEPDCKRLKLLLGGRDKNLPWEQLQNLSNESQIAFYFFGECAKQAQALTKLAGPSFPHLEAALDAAFAGAQKGDWILLSPGGTSLDQFKNFEDRGQFFKNWLQRKKSNIRT